MQEYAKIYSLFQPLTKENGGHGETILYGYRYAIENKADYIFQTDFQRIKRYVQNSREHRDKPGYVAEDEM